MTRPGLFVSLVAIWLLAWGDLSVANVLSGVAVAAAMMLVFPVQRLNRSQRGVIVRPAAIARLAVHYVVELLRSNVVVARDVLDPRAVVHPGFVTCPLRTGSGTVATVLANLLALSPGTMAVDVTESPPTVVVHVLQLRSEEAVRRRVAHLEELVARAVGSQRALAALDGGGGRDVILATALVLVASATCFMVRLLRGPSLADRVLATNGLLLVGMAGIATHAVATGIGSFLPTIVVVALVGFIGTAIIARFIEVRGTS